VVALPLAGILMVTAASVGYYNFRVTGSALRMPYIAHEEQYGIAPLFVFDEPRPEPVFRHNEIRDLQRDYARFHDRQMSVKGMASAVVKKVGVVFKAYSWSGLLLVPLLGLPWALRRDRWLVFALLIGVFFTMAMLLGTWVFPHYAAPAAGLFMALVMQSLRHVRIWRREAGKRGLAVCRAVYALCALSVCLVTWKLVHRDTQAWFYQRDGILQKLEAQGGRHLVVVRYSPRHNPHREWVYNKANIDGAPVVWAREMDADAMRKLLAYFHDRTVWVVDADAARVELWPWAAAPSFHK
jgi:hypothetical protein